MPLVMDDDMDIDDLFGDGAGLSMPARPPSKELIQKVDDMRRSSCNKKMVWSKTGLIVSITPSGYGIEMRNIRCHPDNGSWDLSEPTIISHFNQNFDGGPLQHIQCSPTGNEMAVIDSAGRVAIISITNCINKPAMFRPALRDQVDDLHAVAGCHWFNSFHSQIVLVHGPAVLDGPQHYRYENTQFKTPSGGPWHPIQTQSSFLCLTVNGVLRLLFPEPKSAWSEARLELESVVSSDDLITHAAFCNEKNYTVLIAYATANKQLCLVRVSVDWGIPPEPRNAPISLNPRLEAEHLSVGSWMVSEAQEDINSKFSMGNPPQAKSSMVYLSHLDILPAVIDRNGEVLTPPTVITVRSHLPPSSSNFNQEVYSTIDRWTLQESTQTLHSAFEHLSLRRNSNGSSSNNIYRHLKSMICLTIDKIILSIQYLNPALPKTFCIAYSDGSIEYRDRDTLAEIVLTDSDSLQRLTHLSQVGFTYGSDEPCVQVAMSPTFCSAVQMDNGGKIRWKRLEYHTSDMIPVDAQRTAANAAFSVCIANALHQHATIDDLLDIAFRSRSSPSLSFQTDLPPELARILNLRVDFSSEPHHDGLVRNIFLHAILGFQNSLGFSGDLSPRSFTSKLSWIALSIRHCVFITTLAGNQKPRAPEPGNPSPMLSLEDPEIVGAILGIFRWSLDLMAWITDSLLSLLDAFHSCSYDLAKINTILHDTRIPTLHLLLSSAIRGLLTALCRRITHLDYTARKALSLPPQAAKPNLTPELRASYHAVATLTSTAVISHTTFETFLQKIDGYIREAYISSNLAGSNQNVLIARNALETKLLLCYPIPGVMRGVVERIFTDEEGGLKAVLGRVVGGIDSLFFMDFGERVGWEVEGDGVRGPDSGLLTPSSSSSDMVERPQMRLMDGFYKKWIPVERLGATSAGVARAGGGQVQQHQQWKLKRCMRCGLCMEELFISKMVNHWLVAQQRKCPCGGNWNLLVPGRRVA